MTRASLYSQTMLWVFVQGTQALDVHIYLNLSLSNENSCTILFNAKQKIS